MNLPMLVLIIPVSEIMEKLTEAFVYEQMALISPECIDHNRGDNPQGSLASFRRRSLQFGRGYRRIDGAPHSARGTTVVLLRSGLHG